MTTDQFGMPTRRRSGGHTRGHALLGIPGTLLAIVLLGAGAALAYYADASSGIAHADANALAAPATFSTSTLGTAVTLSWAAPATGPAPTGYSLSGTLGGPGGSCAAAMTAGTTSCTVEGLAAGSYTWLLSATIDSWNSPADTAGATVVTLIPSTLPSAIVSSAYSQTVTASGGNGSYTYSVTSGSLPTGLSLSTSGLLSGTPTAAGSFSFTVTANDTASHSGFQSYTVTVFLGLAPSDLPAGTFNSPYSQTVTASGGNGSYTYSVTSGFLPTGLSLSTSGLLSGTPTAAGSSSFTVTADDTAGNTGSQSYTVVIGLALGPSAVPAGTVNSPYSQTVTASGGNGSYTYSVTSGSLPTGLSLSTSGLLSGTPTAAGSSSFTVTATDTAGNTGSQSYTVVIGLALSPSDLPTGTVNSPYSQTVTASGGNGSYSFSVTSGSLPTGLSLSASGLLSGTPTAAAAYSFTVTATDTAGNSGSQSYTVVIGLGISPTNLTPATANSPYSQTLTASGGNGSYSFSVTSGSPPTGLSLSASGLLSGTPAASGSYGFTVTATDTAGNSGSQSYTLTVALGFSPSTLTAATVGTAFSQTVTAQGGNGHYVYSLSSGSLPTGLSLNTSTGAITGTPTAAGSFSFTVGATDTAGDSGARSYTLTVALGLSPSTLTAGTVGTVYSQTVTAQGGDGHYAYSLSSGSLPTGLSLNTSTGAITGTPTAAGSFSFTVGATDTAGDSGARSYTVTVALGFSPSTLTAGTVGTVYSQTVNASGGNGSYTYSLSGSLPAGLSLNTSTGAITGTPTAAGSFSFTVGATDTAGHAGSRSYTVVVSLGVSPATLPAATVGVAVNQAITASGGTSPYSFSITGSLPAGLTLSSGGSLSGTPTAGGSFNFTVSATDSASPQNTGSRAYSLTVNAPTITLNPTTLPSGTVGTAYNQSVTASGGTSPYTYAVSSGSLSPGLSLNNSTGAITGTPSTSTGSPFSFTIKATDTSTGTGPYSATQAYTVTINPAVTLVLQTVSGANGNDKVAFMGTGTPGASITVTICTVNSFPCPTSPTNDVSATATATIGVNGVWTSGATNNNLAAGGQYFAQAVQTSPSGTSGVLTFNAEKTTNATVSFSAPASGTCYYNSNSANCTTTPKSSWSSESAKIAGSATDSGGQTLSTVHVAIENPSGQWWSGTAFASSVPVYNLASGTSTWSYGITAAQLDGTTGTFTVNASATDTNNETGAITSQTFVWEN